MKRRETASARTTTSSGKMHGFLHKRPRAWRLHAFLHVEHWYNAICVDLALDKFLDVLCLGRGPGSLKDVPARLL